MQQAPEEIEYIKNFNKQIIETNKIGITEGFRIENDKGYNLVRATKNFQPNEIVLISKCMKILSYSDRYSLQKTVTDHIYMDAPSIFLNHSCEPNLKACHNEHYAYDFVAIKPINVNDELTFDYETLEETIDFFKECFCNSAKCRKIIRGFKYYKD